MTRGANSGEFRASYAKTVVGTIKRLDEARAQQVFARVGSELRTRIREYGTLAWMPGAEFLQLVRSVGQALGPEASQPFWRDCLELSLGRRLLAPLRAGAVAIHGHTPGALLRMTPQAWQLVSRDAGVCSVQVLDAQQLQLQFRSLPEPMLFPEMLWVWEGGSLACVERMGCRGSALGRVTGPGAVDVSVRWEPVSA